MTEISNGCMAYAPASAEVSMKKLIKKLGFYLILIILSILLSSFLNWQLAIAEAPDEMQCSEYTDIRVFAKCEIEKKWGESEWQAFDTIIHKESSWNYKAKNPKSSARGLPQALTSLHDLPTDYLTNPQTQILWGIEYIDDRYGTPTKALNFHQIHTYY